METLYTFDDASLGVPKQNYHVSPKGNDADPGTSRAPWKTIGKAARTLRAGERALIHAGSYTEQAITFANSGREGAYLHLEAAPGEAVVLVGREPLRGIRRPDGTESAFCIAGNSYVHLKGFKFEKHICAVFIDSDADHIVIDNIEVTKGRDGVVVVAGSYIVCRHVYCHDNVHHEVMHRDNFLIGISFGRHERGCKVKQALCEDCVVDNTQTGMGEGYDINNTDGIVAELGSEGLVLRRCYCSRAGDAGFDIKVPVLIEDSTASGNLHFGFKLWNPASRLVNCVSAWNHRAGVNGACNMMNCTIYGNTTAIHIEPDLPWPAPSQIEIKNCIIAEDSGKPRFHFDPVKFFSAAKSEGNILFHIGESETVLARKPGYTTADPMFVDGANGDLRLREGSPALGAGAPEGALDHDITGLRRKDRIDGGAYQYGAGNHLPLPHGGIRVEQGACLFMANGKGCATPAETVGLCAAHYSKLLKLGLLNKYTQPLEGKAETVAGKPHAYLDKNVLFEYASHELLQRTCEVNTGVLVRAILRKEIQGTVGADSLRSLYGYLRSRLAQDKAEDGEICDEDRAEKKRASLSAISSSRKRGYGVLSCWRIKRLSRRSKRC